MPHNVNGAGTLALKEAQASQLAKADRAEIDLAVQRILARLRATEIVNDVGFDFARKVLSGATFEVPSVSDDGTVTLVKRPATLRERTAVLDLMLRYGPGPQSTKKLEGAVDLRHLLGAQGNGAAARQGVIGIPDMKPEDAAFENPVVEVGDDGVVPKPVVEGREPKPALRALQAHLED